MSARPAHDGAPMRPVAFLVTFLGAWTVLDRLVPSPLRAGGSAVALLAAGTVLVVGEIAFGRHRSPKALVARLGLGRPDPRAIVAALVVAGAVVATTVGGARLLGIDLELRPRWPEVLIGVVLFHGIAEELVWRGFAFGHLRRSAAFWRAIARSIPLIALTHVPIIFGNGVAIGSLAVLSAATTCLPLAYLWERGGHTIWGPAIVHGSVGTWQLFLRSFPASFSVLILLSSIVVPLSASLFGDRFFRGTVDPDATDHVPTVALDAGVR